MAHPVAGESSLAATICDTFEGNVAKPVHDPTDVLERLRRLHEAEFITLFTPCVPHPPSTTLAKDMDPFEPLGRALPRRVRHVPYSLDNGMTVMHADFLAASGAIMIVICATANIVDCNAKAFDQQLNFAKDISKRLEGDDSIAGIPLVLLLVDHGVAGQTHVNAIRDFQVLVTIGDYTTPALTDAVQVLFGRQQ